MLSLTVDETGDDRGSALGSMMIVELAHSSSGRRLKRSTLPSVWGRYGPVHFVWVIEPTAHTAVQARDRSQAPLSVRTRSTRTPRSANQESARTQTPRGRALFVVEDFGIRHPGAVVDRRCADRGSRHPERIPDPAVDPTAATGGDRGHLLDVNMDELARTFALIAPHRRRRGGAPITRSRPEARPGMPCTPRGGHADPMRDALRPSGTGGAAPPPAATWSAVSPPVSTAAGWSGPLTGLALRRSGPATCARSWRRHGNAPRSRPRSDPFPAHTPPGADDRQGLHRVGMLRSGPSYRVVRGGPGSTCGLTHHRRARRRVRRRLARHDSGRRFLATT
jgi:hypothetical protein